MMDVCVQMAIVSFVVGCFPAGFSLTAGPANLRIGLAYVLYRVQHVSWLQPLKLISIKLTNLKALPETFWTWSTQVKFSVTPRSCCHSSYTMTGCSTCQYTEFCISRYLETEPSNYTHLKNFLAYPGMTVLEK